MFIYCLDNHDAILDKYRDRDDNSMFPTSGSSTALPSPVDIIGSTSPSSPASASIGEEVDQKRFFYSQKRGFDEVGATTKMVEVLKSLGIHRPSKIQSLSFRCVLDGKHCIIAGLASEELHVLNVCV